MARIWTSILSVRVIAKDEDPDPLTALVGEDEEMAGERVSTDIKFDKVTRQLL